MVTTMNTKSKFPGQTLSSVNRDIRRDIKPFPRCRLLYIIRHRRGLSNPLHAYGLTPLWTKNAGRLSLLLIIGVFLGSHFIQRLLVLSWCRGVEHFGHGLISAI